MICNVVAFSVLTVLIFNSALIVESHKNADKYIIGKYINHGWVKHNKPVFGGGKLGTCFDATLLVQLAEKTKYSMYFGWRGKESIGLTVSDDGINWKHPREVLRSQDPGRFLNRQFVLQLGNKDYKMWYSSQGAENSPSVLHFATSSNGINWIPHPQPVLVPEFPWEKKYSLCTCYLQFELSSLSTLVQCGEQKRT